MKNPARPELLIVDDEAPVLHALHRLLRRHFGDGLAVASTTSPLEAMRWVAERPFAAVLSDLRMPGVDGLRLLARVAELQPHAALLLLTGVADFSAAQRAVNHVGVFRYLTKPWQDHELTAHVAAAVAHSEASHQRAEQADAWACEHGRLSPQDAERRRLESIEPGITRVEWGPQGEVLMPPLEPAPPPTPRRRTPV